MYSELPFTLIDITPPIVANAIPNQLVNVPNAFNFTVPGNTFVDQSGMPLSYSATLANGAPLPAWLSFDPGSSTFSGTPAATDEGTLQLFVTATDPVNQQASAPFTLTVTPPLATAQGLGLLGAYYNGDNFNSFGTDEIDAQVGFNWNGFPIADTSDNSEIWTGQVLAPQTGAYTFYALACGYSRLWVNGQLLYDWADSWNYSWISGSINLQGGQLYDITLEYYDPNWTNNLYVYLDWSYPGQGQQVIPQSQLYGNPACTLDNTILSNLWPVGSTVAHLLGVPGEAGVTLSYALVPGDGSDDNSAFTINGSTLLSAAPFNYAAQSTYHIRIGTTDSNGMYSEFPFILSVYTPPTVANPIPDQVVTEPNSYQYIVPGDTFAETQGALSYSATLANGSPLPAWLTFNPGKENFGAQLVGTYSTDTTTQGSWEHGYGGSGYVLCAWNGSDVVSLNGSYVQSVTPSGANYCCWTPDTNDPRATLNPATDTRSAACWFSGGTFDVNINLVNPNDGVVHCMAVYCLDWDGYGSGGRSQTLDVLNATTGQSELNGGPVAVSNFVNGTWVVFYFTGNVTLQVTNTNSNAVISAIAFGGTPPTFSGTPGPGDVGTLQLALTATGPENLSATDTFNLTVQPPSVTGQGLGLLGTYCNGNSSWTDYAAIEIDPQLAFNWSNFPIADTSLNLEMWSGQVLAPQTGAYTFSTVACGYTKLQVNGQMLYDWASNWNFWRDGTITLQAGQRYDITLWYEDPQWTNTLYLYLEWSYPGQGQQPIPQSQLYGDPYCTLDNTLISNSLPVGGLVANILGTPGEAGVTLSYALALGDGSEDNNAFTINGSTLLSAVPFNYAVQNTYYIRIRVTDSNGLSGEYPFILYVQTPPLVATAIPNQYVIVPNAFSYTVPANTFTDPVGAALSYSATLADGSALPAWLSFDPIAVAFSGTPAITDVATLQILVTATDADNQQVSAPFTLYVYPPTQPAGQGLGLLGTYYNGVYDSFATDEIDPQLSYWWGSFPVTDSTYSVLWTGKVLAPQSGPYTFTTLAYGDTRLQVNGQMLYDWDWSWYNWPGGTVTLQAGQLYDISVWYYNEGWSSPKLNLYWSYPGQGQQVIPQSQLYGDPACNIDNIFISNSLPVGGTVANILSGLGEANVTLSFALVNGDGSEDNGAFTINGTTLLSAVPFNYTVQNTYNIRIRTTDSNGLYSEFPFTLYVQTPPTLANAIPDQYVVVPNAFNFTVPSSTFADSIGAPLSYNATLADGSPLPAWLSFDPIACAFSGTPDITDVGALQILVIAVDADNQQVSAPFTLYVEPPQLPAGQGLGLLGYYYNGIFGSFSTDKSTRRWRLIGAISR